MAIWYVSSVDFAALSAWQASTSYSVGVFIRPTNSYLNSLTRHRVYRCTTAGTSGATEPSWNRAKGATTNDGSAVWTEVTGNEAYGWTAAYPFLFLASGYSSADATDAHTVSDGDKIYVGHDHSVSYSSLIATSTTLKRDSGVLGVPLEIICVNRNTGEVATTASEVVDPDANMAMYAYGNLYVYGLEYRGRTAALSATSGSDTGISARQIWEKCKLGTTRTGAASMVRIGPATTGSLGQSYEFYDCTWIFGNTGSRLESQGCSDTLICGGSFSGTAPISFVRAVRGNSSAVIIGMDLTGLTNVIDVSGAGIDVKTYGCKGSPWAFTNKNNACRVEDWVSVRAGVYGKRIDDIFGSMLPETTIYRSGGAVNGSGTNFCFKFIGRAACKRFHPFYVRIADLHGDLSGKKVTVFAARKNAAGSKLNSAQCWIALGSPGNASAHFNRYSTAPATPVTAGSAYADSTETWATLNDPYQWKMEIDVPANAAQKGLNCIWFYVGTDLVGFLYTSWSSLVTYASGDYVLYNDAWYVSLQNGNLNKNPATETAWWSVVNVSTEIYVCPKVLIT